MKRRPLSLLLVCAVIMALLAGADLASKQWALETLSAEYRGTNKETCVPTENGYVPPQRRPIDAVVLIDGWLEFSYTENCGAAFGLMRDVKWRVWVFFIAALFAMIGLPWMLWTGRGGRAFVCSVPFIMAGALGNMVDRIHLGYVVDFIRFYTRDGWLFLNPGWEYPTFNVADMCIVTGVILVLIDSIQEGRKEKAMRAQAAQAETNQNTSDTPVVTEA